MEEYEQIGKAQKGDQSALAELLQAHYLFVFKYLVQLTLQRQLAEDLTQETMIRAIKHIKRYQATKSRFSSWLITIATRLYLDEKRKRKREQDYVINADALSANASRLLLWELEKQQSQWLTMMEALAKLTDDQRTAILLQHYYGYTLQEIATMMQIPLGTVKSRIHYGMEQIRKEWEQDEKRAKNININA